MRVIAGTAKGRRLYAPKGMETRPITAKIKEALFNIWQDRISGSDFLDLFAGSGQLGIEALSRGARCCIFVDQSVQSQQVIKQNLTTTQLASKARVAAMDAKAFIRSTGETFDIALLDPPYDSGILPEVLPLVAEKMNDGGAILCETRLYEELPEEVGQFYLKKNGLLIL